LLYDNELTPDVKEFLAWRLARSSGKPDDADPEEKPPGKPDVEPPGEPEADPPPGKKKKPRKKKLPLPAKFHHLQFMAKDEILYDAVMAFQMARARGYAKTPDEPFSYKREIKKLGTLGGKVDAIVRRSRKSRYRR